MTTRPPQDQASPGPAPLTRATVTTRAAALAQQLGLDPRERELLAQALADTAQEAAEGMRARSAAVPFLRSGEHALAAQAEPGHTADSLALRQARLLCLGEAHACQKALQALPLWPEDGQPLPDLSSLDPAKVQARTQALRQLLDDPRPLVVPGTGKGS